MNIQRLIVLNNRAIVFIIDAEVIELDIRWQGFYDGLTFDRGGGILAVDKDKELFHILFFVRKDPIILS